MERNFERFEEYLDNLLSDHYAQPPDEGHTEYAQKAIDWAYDIIDDTSVRALGCCQGFCEPMFRKRDIAWVGVTIGEDYAACRKKGLKVFREDMTFLPFLDDTFDGVFSRHTLEHSPFPILTLMEWRRVCTKHLVLVLPSPDYWGSWGRNHYSVFDKERWWWAFARAGWKIIHEKEVTTNDRLFLDHYMPEITDVGERRQLKFPGPPKSVEFWMVLEKTEERIE